VDSTTKTVALHANLAEKNDIENLTTHYKELITNGLDAEKVELVVTDMLPAYNSVIADIFPNAAHQYCIFHFIQSLNIHFKTALKEHRTTAFEAGSRKEAHKISFLLLKGQEKLSVVEREIVCVFTEQYPTVAADYALKEDIRTLYSAVQTPAQAYAYLDILNDLYTNLISPMMQEGLEWMNKHFDKTIAFLSKGYFLDRTNNDAERMMRKIKRIQHTHYFLRKDENYIKKVKVVLGIQNPIAT
jgi:transposase-like protein